MTDESTWDGASPWLFLIGLLVFLGSALLFLIDFVRSVDVFRSVAANTVGAAMLITWAAHDTLRDPNSEVATVGGAAGTALLLYGLYLFAAGVVIAITGLFHDRLVLGLLYVALAFAAATVGFVIFPRGAVLDEDDEHAGGDGDTSDSDAGDGSDSDAGEGSDSDADDGSDSDADESPQAPDDSADTDHTASETGTDDESETGTEDGSETGKAETPDGEGDNRS